MFKQLFELRGKLSPKTSIAIQVSGFIILMMLWFLISLNTIQAILPSPIRVIQGYSELFVNNNVLNELGFSIKINLLGYLEALLVAIPLGFIIGLFPLMRELFRKYIDAVRYLPLSALTGLFIVWCGISTLMKVQFLAFGIMVYLLPVVVQRVEETESVYCDTLYTLGGNKWDIIRHVFIPDVLSKIIDDIRVLVAISWTYIIMAETLNKSEGGIGALIYTCSRMSRIDKVFALLAIIVLIGFVQDKVISWLSTKLFPHKEVK